MIDQASNQPYMAVSAYVAPANQPGPGAKPHGEMALDKREIGSNTGLSPEQRRRAEKLTSLFENSTLELQYEYAEELGDGRGVTAGRAGFCSGTSDMYDVVKHYTQAVPKNPLARYLPRLAELDAHARRGHAKEAGSTQGLEGLDKAWARAAKDPRFKREQDLAVERTYFRPAMAHATDLRIRSALGRAILYDSAIQHGDAENYPDSLPALIKRTNAKAGGTPRSGIGERHWLEVFCQVRRAALAHAFDPATRKVWAESVGRADVLAHLVKSGNMDLKGPIRLDCGGYSCVIP